MRQCGRGNALNGATFISTKRNREKNKTAAKRVNALNGATFISTNGSWLSGKEVECVNALNGATFISTDQVGKFVAIAAIVSMP